LKKMHRAEGGAKILGVFRVKNHDFTPKNHIFSNFRGGGACRMRPPPLDLPLLEIKDTTDTARSASYLDVHLEIDREGRLRTQL
jgi:hypothetical protein